MTALCLYFHRHPVAIRPLSHVTLGNPPKALTKAENLFQDLLIFLSTFNRKKKSLFRKEEQKL